MSFPATLKDGHCQQKVGGGRKATPVILHATDAQKKYLIANVSVREPVLKPGLPVVVGFMFPGAS